MSKENGIKCAPDTIRQYLPLSLAFRSRLVEVGGNMQRNFAFESEGVVHVPPALLEVTEDEALICQRWVSENKPVTLLKRHQLTKGLSERLGVCIPQVFLVGNALQDEVIYDFWYESFLEGKPLNEAVFCGFGYEGYSQLVTWLAEFHRHLPVGESLQTYYRNRLSAMARIFSTESNLINSLPNRDVDLIRDMVDVRLNELEEIVELSERTEIIHGDFRGGNIIVRANNQVGVIDFEQGLYGGDWFCDLAKLLEYFKDKMPDPDRPHFYRPPLSSAQKRSLTEIYLECRSRQGWTPPDFLEDFVSLGDLGCLARRHDLVNFDTIVSVVVLRLAMGWNFYQGKVDGKEVRGVEYLIEKLKKDHA